MPAEPISLVIVAQSEYTHWAKLEQLPQVATALQNALTQGGRYSVALPKLIQGGTRSQVAEPLSRWLHELPEKTRLVIYWTGHGFSGRDHMLVLKDAPLEPTPIDDGLPTAALGNAIGRSKAEKVLVLLDTCYAGQGAGGIAAALIDELNTHVERPGYIRFFGVIASAHALQQAPEGVFGKILTDILDGDGTIGRDWTDHDDVISFSALADAAHAALQSQIRRAPSTIAIGHGGSFLPNPRYQEGAPAMDVERARQPRKATRRGIEPAEDTELFTGRERVLGELARWRRRGSGLLVLTGPAGSGKSTVLSQFVMREGLTATAPAKGRTAVELERELGAPEGALWVVDGIDEAREPLAVAATVRSAVEKGARVVVGTRRSLVGPTPADADRHARLREAFGSEARILDLEDESDTEADIAAYVSRRLSQPDALPRSEANIADLATQVAERAEGVFLYARIVARRLVREQEVRLPINALAAFEYDLDRRFVQRRAEVEALLSALAWAEGGGLSRAVWPRVAAALSRGQGSVDVAWVLAAAGTYVLEAGEAGQTVYRLVHEALAEHLRAKVADPRATQEAIARALTGEPYA
jgi:hypothetical protein